MRNSLIQDDIKSCLRRVIDKLVKLTGGGEDVPDILPLDTRFSVFMFVYLSVTLVVTPTKFRNSLWGQEDLVGSVIAYGARRRFWGQEESSSTLHT